MLEFLYKHSHTYILLEVFMTLFSLLSIFFVNLSSNDNKLGAKNAMAYIFIKDKLQSDYLAQVLEKKREML